MAAQLTLCFPDRPCYSSTVALLPPSLTHQQAGGGLSCRLADPRGCYSSDCSIPLESISPTASRPDLCQLLCHVLHSCPSIGNMAGIWPFSALSLPDDMCREQPPSVVVHCCVGDPQSPLVHVALDGWRSLASHLVCRHPPCSGSNRNQVLNRRSFWRGRNSQ